MPLQGIKPHLYFPIKKEIHDIVYQEVEKEVPKEAFEKLIANNDYRKECYENIEVFFHELAFYRVKPLYVRMVYFFQQLGFSFVYSTIIPSIIAFICISFI